MFLADVILTIYLINIFTPFGLIFWEIAFLAFPLCILIGLICAVRILKARRRKIPKYKHNFLVASLIFSIAFSIFAFTPTVWNYSLGQHFEQEFQSALGEDYFEQIPEKYRDRLMRSGRYWDMQDLRNFYDRDVEMETIDYGEGKYQILDKYEDPTIKDTDKPAFIFVHGGGSLASEPGGTGKWECVYFASLGFVSFSIEYTPAPIEPFPRAVADVMQGLVFIKAHHEEYNIDNDSIVLYGGSRGGHLVTQVAYVGANNEDWWRKHGANYTANQLKVACVVDLYGAVDQIYEYEHNGYLDTRNRIIF